VLAAAYIPRETQESTLVWLLRTHLDAFIEQAERDSGPGLPGFVERQLRAMIDCGDLTRGFVRLECSSCRGPRIVPFSCKTRLCSSCAGRRMNEQACHLVDRVLPRAPYRQWVLTLPPELARRVAFDAELAGKVFGLFAAELARWQEETARAAGVDDPQAGSVMEVQRFADGARLWPHAHVLAPDGVFHEASDGSVRFVGHAAPCERDLVLVLTRLESRVLSYLKRLRPASDEDADESEDPAQLLLACSRTAASADTASKPTASARRRSRPRQRLCVRSETGFELHAEVRVPSLVAIGTTPNRLAAQLVLESVFLCTVGALLGVGLGAAAVAYNAAHGLDMSAFASSGSGEGISWAGIAFDNVIYFRLDVAKLGPPVLWTAVVALFCGLWPALKAARANPVTAISGRG